MHVKTKYNGIVAYTFRNIGEKIHQFVSSIMCVMHTKESWFLFLPHGVWCHKPCREHSMLTYNVTTRREAFLLTATFSLEVCGNRFFVPIPSNFKDFIPIPIPFPSET